jgi:hypothetical protein
MDAIIMRDGPDRWTVASAEGIMLGSIEKQAVGYTILPSAGSQLADLDVPTFVSMEAARDGIAAHLQGRCVIDESGDSLRGER